MYFLYVLKNKTSGKIYIGQTENLEKRLNQHNNRGFHKNSYTKINKGLWEIVYKETYKTRQEVYKREKELKSSRGRNFIHNVIIGPIAQR